MQICRASWLRHATLLLSAALTLGCAEGPFSGLGGLNPWVREKWAEEEQYVQSLYGRREQLRRLASQASSMPAAEQERVSQELARLLREDPVDLLRIEAIKTIAAFPTATAASTLNSATKDKDADVRIAACLAMKQRPEQEATRALEEVLRSDSDIDVRLAATEALGAFRSPAAVQALGIALDETDPAVQHRAMRSLQSASGQDFGMNAVAWRDFVKGGALPSNKGTSVVDRFTNWLK
jgi:hypothetical protein